MAEMKDMFKLARYIASEKYDSIDSGTQETQSHAQALHNLVRLYKEKSGASGDKVTRIIEAAMEHEYIKFVGSNRTGVIFDVTPVKGNHLIAKKWFIPGGLIDESLKNY